jgi:hypothetical protein
LGVLILRRNDILNSVAIIGSGWKHTDMESGSKCIALVDMEANTQV